MLWDFDSMAMKRREKSGGAKSGSQQGFGPNARVVRSPATLPRDFYPFRPPASLSRVVPVRLIIGFSYPLFGTFGFFFCFYYLP